MGILKNIAFVFIGIILGMFVNMGLIYIGGYAIELPENFDPMNAINWELKYFIFPFLAHALGTFSGALLVSKLSKNSSIVLPLIIGVYFLAGGIYMVTILPAPYWFIILDSVLRLYSNGYVGMENVKKIITFLF